ncbi:hypothetical protein DUNSADRAFT_2209 [Dunaliella salina]|uniref:ENTH domain-containing protein n=1 Tax=Dunaliella salina TaxID=3046 RepID=A0ABQ7GW32_DUNSA|nr:hypothetical protein DUNSADRAFT_2209 [Dunaliella salina]|eukprot:KAF5838824.1 hypothetical protein DUNSADRAFT_2209 [Dunaliella salina]
MSGILGNLQRWKIVEEVTSSRDDAPPLYLMKQLAEMTKESPEQRAAIAEQIHKALSNKSPVVKQKALRLVKHLCTEGSPHFQRAMQLHAAGIRDLTQFKGEPDPFKGDAPARHVRELAKEALDMLYNSTPSSMQGSGGSLKGRIQGFGNTAPPPSGPGRGSPAAASGASSIGGSGQGRISSSRMVGFGNAAFDNPPPPPPPPVSSPNSQSSGFGLPPSSDFKSSSNGVTLINKGSGVFGRPWANETPSHSTPAEQHSPSASDPVSGSEQILLDTLTQPGGVRAQPPKEDLQHFVEAASSMDGLKMAELMREKLGSDHWQVVLRTLCVLDAILNSGMSQACGEVAVMFQSDPDCVRALQTSHHPLVREKATACMKVLLSGSEEPVDMLGVSDGAPAPKLPPPPPSANPLSSSSSSGGKPHAAPPKDPFDLLGDLEPSLPQPSASSSGAIPASSAASAPAAAAAAPTAAATAPTPQAAPSAASFDPFAPSESLPPPSAASPGANPGTAAPPTPSSPAPGGNGPSHTPGAPAATTNSKPAPPPPLDDFFAEPAQPPLVQARGMPLMQPGIMPGGGMPQGGVPLMQARIVPGGGMQGGGIPVMQAGAIPGRGLQGGVMPSMQPGSIQGGIMGGIPAAAVGGRGMYMVPGMPGAVGMPPGMLGGIPGGGGPAGTYGAAGMGMGHGVGQGGGRMGAAGGMGELQGVQPGMAGGMPPMSSSSMSPGVGGGMGVGAGHMGNNTGAAAGGTNTSSLKGDPKQSSLDSFDFVKDAFK